MNVIMCEHQFEAPILAATKMQTIRRNRRDGRPRARAGELVSLRVWKGKAYRSKQREFAKAKVWTVIPIRITTTRVERLDLREPRQRRLNRTLVARRDGFQNWEAMKSWFQSRHGLPFRGVLIAWEKPERAS